MSTDTFAPRLSDIAGALSFLGNDMRKLYARFVLWLIRPALEERETNDLSILRKEIQDLRVESQRLLQSTFYPGV